MAEGEALTMSQPITVHLAVRDQSYLAMMPGGNRSTSGCSGDLLESVRSACKLPNEAYFVNEHHELEAIRAATRNRRVILRVRHNREIHFVGNA